MRKRLKVALVAIAKNEDQYIQEWVLYYLGLGFEKIFVYMNDWNCEYSHPSLVKIPFNGPVRQKEAYNDWLQRYSASYDYAAFFDVDEFLVLKDTNDIDTFLYQYKDTIIKKNAAGLGINWYMFGDSNLSSSFSEKDDLSVVDRFRYRQNSVNPHVKTILRCNNRSILMGVHNPDNAHLIDENGTPFSGPFNYQGTNTNAQLNHYFTKTIQEFIGKVNRGRADVNQKRTLLEFTENNFNDVEDLGAIKQKYHNYKK